MKRSMALLICGLLYTTVLIGVRQARLPDSFYMIGQEKNPSLFEIPKEESIFYVLIPAAAESEKEDIQAPETLSAFTRNRTLEVPTSFFDANFPKQNTQPLYVYFDWRDTSPGVNKIKDSAAATQLAQGLDYLKKSLSGKVIVVTQGRGGLVFNVASSLLKESVPVVIQLGVPIPQDTKKFASLTPNPSKIDALYLFYSEKPFKFSKPSLHPKYVQDYQSIANLNYYSTLVLINNQQPEQSELYNDLIGKNLLDLCYEIRKHYQVNRNLFASLSTVKEDTNLLVGIKVPSDKTSDDAIKEKKYSDSVTKLFSAAWKRPPALSLSSGERIRSRYRYKKS